MRISGRDEVVLQRAGRLSPEDLHTWFNTRFLLVVEQNGHGRDFLLPTTDAFTVVPPDTDSFFTVEKTPSGEPEVKFWLQNENDFTFSKRYPIYDEPEPAGSSTLTKCSFKDHPMLVGEPLYVVHASRRPGGKIVKIFGCEDCADELYERGIPFDEQTLLSSPRQ